MTQTRGSWDALGSAWDKFGAKRLVLDKPLVSGNVEMEASETLKNTTE
jgi:hypothetical protein